MFSFEINGFALKTKILRALKKKNVKSGSPKNLTVIESDESDYPFVRPLSRTETAKKKIGGRVSDALDENRTLEKGRQDTRSSEAKTFNCSHYSLYTKLYTKP